MELIGPGTERTKQVTTYTVSSMPRLNYFMPVREEWWSNSLRIIVKERLIISIFQTSVEMEAF